MDEQQNIKWKMPDEKDYFFIPLYEIPREDTFIETESS